MRAINIIILILCLICTDASLATTKKTSRHHRQKRILVHNKSRHTARTTQIAHRGLRPAAKISPTELAGFDHYPRSVKKLITEALALADQNLSYKFGSTDPQNKGMDCSGTISYLLKQENIRDVPRQADEIYQWAWQKGDFYAVNGHRFGSFEFSEMKPGDLLFWSGTYPVQRDPAVTHVMMYLGRDKNNRPLMFGATSGRAFHGEARDGVGVFDFSVPPPHSKARFLGYGCIPHLTCGVS
jgi:cell wall-associated NlpC family hydrolase